MSSLILYRSDFIFLVKYNVKFSLNLYSKKVKIMLVMEHKITNRRVSGKI